MSVFNALNKRVLYTIILALFFIISIQVYYILHTEDTKHRTVKITNGIRRNSNIRGLIKEPVQKEPHSSSPTNIPHEEEKEEKEDHEKEEHHFDHHDERDTLRHDEPEDKAAHQESYESLKREQKKIEEESKDILKKKIEINNERMKKKSNQREHDSKVEDIATQNEHLNVRIEKNRKLVFEHHMKTYKHKKDLLLHPVLMKKPDHKFKGKVLIHGGSSYLGMMVSLYFTHHKIPVAIIAYEEEQSKKDRIRLITLRERLAATHPDVPFFENCESFQKAKVDYTHVIDLTKHNKLCSTIRGKTHMDFSGGKVVDETATYHTIAKLPQVVGPYLDDDELINTLTNSIVHQQKASISTYNNKPIPFSLMSAKDFVKAILWALEHAEKDSLPATLNLKHKAPVVTMDKLAEGISKRLGIKATLDFKKIKKEVMVNKGKSTCNFRFSQRNILNIVSDYVYWYTEFHFPTTILTSTFLTGGKDPQRGIKYRASDPSKMMNYYRSVHALKHPLVVIILYDEHADHFIRTHSSAVFRFKKVVPGANRPSLNDDRFWLFRDLLKSYMFEEKQLIPYRPHYFLFSDLFDVKVVKNPVELIAAEPNTLYVGRDVQDVIGRNSWLVNRMRVCGLEKYIDDHFFQQLVNPGLFGATAENAMLLMETVIGMFDGIRKSENCNMPIFNLSVQKLLREKGILHHHGPPFGSPFTKNVCNSNYYLCHK